MQRHRSTTRFAIFIIGALLGAASLPGAADTPAAGDSPAAAEPQPAAVVAEPAVPAQKPKVICKFEKVTGSQIKKRTCRTEAQTANDHRASQEYLDRVQSSAGVNGGAAGGL